MPNTNQLLDVQYAGAKELYISDTEKKKCYFYKLSMPLDTTPSISHHILLLDVSGSMYGVMEQLKVKVAETLRALKTKPDQYVSVILYSGHGECYRLINAVRCDTLSYKMAKVYEVLEEELYTRSITVMSEPLEKAVEIVQGLGDVCDKHHIALFTDGYLVPSKWSYEEEEGKCFEVAKYCEKHGIHFNTIGFGKYYDRDFLRRLVALGKTGVFMHMDAMKDYYKTMVQLVDEVNEKYIIDIPIHNEDYFLFETHMRHQVMQDSISLQREGENIIVTFDAPLVTDSAIKTTENEVVADEVVDELYYQLAFYHLMREDLESAEFALAQTGDVAAYEKVRNAYTFEEKGRSLEVLDQLLHNPHKRYEKGREELQVTLPEEEPLCLLEVLGMILENKEAKLLWKYDYPYKRIGMKRKEVPNGYRFIRPELGYGEVIDLSIGRKKLNIGVKVKIEGMVEELETGLKVGASVYRDYNLVIDGNVNTNELWCELPKEIVRCLRKEKLIKKTMKLRDRRVYTLNLTKLKATNKRMLKSMSLEEVVKSLYEIQLLECKEWALKKLRSELQANTVTTEVEGQEQLGFLQETQRIKERFRLDATHTYKPEKVEEDLSKPYEIYKAQVLEWKIQRFPSKKYQEEALAAYRDFLIADHEADKQWLEETFKEVAREKRQKQQKVQLVRLACGLIGRPLCLWDSTKEKEKTETDKVLGVNAVVGGTVQIATKKVGEIQFRQDRYQILTKCQ